MNILTKICIVILFVLVLVASVLFINMATEPQNYRAYYENERNKALVNAQAHRYQALHAQRLEDEIKDIAKSRDDLLAELTAVKRDKVPGPDQLMVAELKRTLDQYDARLAELQLLTKALAERNERIIVQQEVLRKDLEEERKSTAQLHRERTELLGKVERADRIVRNLERQYREQQEVIRELERRLAGAGSMGAGNGAVTLTPAPPAKVAGTINTVRGELAGINIGAAQGVVNGMKLYIYRGDRFVGYLRISEVNEGDAAGLVTDKRIDPIAGDKVASDLK